MSSLGEGEKMEDLAGNKFVQTETVYGTPSAPSAARLIDCEPCVKAGRVGMKCETCEGIVAGPPLAKAMRSSAPSSARLATTDPAQLAFDQQSDDPAPGDWNAACRHIADLLRSSAAPAEGEKAPALTIDACIMLWSMRPQPGTPNGIAWEQGARQGWEWAKSLQSATEFRAIGYYDRLHDRAHFEPGMRPADGALLFRPVSAADRQANDG